MRNNKFLILLFFCFAFQGIAIAQKAIIKGTISNFQGNQTIKIFQEDYEKLKSTLLDSLQIDSNGEFYKELIVNEFSFIFLNFFNKLITPIIIQPSEIIELKIDLLTKKYEIKGSPETDKYLKYKAFYDSLMTVYIKPLRDKYPELQQKDTKIYQEFQKKLKEVNLVFGTLLNTYEDNYLGFGPVLYAVGMINWNEEKLLPRVKELEKIKPDAILTQILRKKLDRMLLTAIGSQAPEIELPDKNNQMLKLSSLRGNYVLIDFWASWCKPCRIENPFLVNLYKKYHPLGFEIYSISLDGNKNHWLEAIEKDSLDWYHVSDLKIFQSAFNSVYNINGIPQNFLLDKNGKILAKNIKGEELSKKLKEIFLQKE